MKIKFIGRKEFLNKLKKQVDTDEMSFSLIYGRRRVGKSELVKETLRCANEKSIYFECKQVAEESNVASLSAIVSDVMGLPKLGYTDIESLLDYIGSIIFLVGLPPHSVLVSYATLDRMEKQCCSFITDGEELKNNLSFLRRSTQCSIVFPSPQGQSPSGWLVYTSGSAA